MRDVPQSLNALFCSLLFSSFEAGLKEIAIVRLTVSQTHTHTHTHRRCPSARAGNSSDDPPVCFRNNLPLRLRHRAVALIQMNHFTNLFPPLTRRQSFLSFPPVLFSIFAGPSHCIFSLCFPLLFFDLCYAVDGDEFPSCGFQMLFCFH